MTDDSILKLLTALRGIERKHSFLRGAGIETDGFDGELLDTVETIILDELGFPSDNSLTVSPKSKKFFCRDWLGSGMIGRRTPEQLLKWLKGEARWVQEGMKDGQK